MGSWRVGMALTLIINGFLVGVTSLQLKPREGSLRFWSISDNAFGGRFLATEVTSDRKSNSFV